MRKDFNTPKAKKPKKLKSDSTIPEKTQEQLVEYLETEFDTAKRNMEKFHSDFNEYYNMIHCVREKKPNEWESDIYMPEFTSRLLAQIGNFVGQYFSSRDYVEPDINSDNPVDVAEAKASKRLLNTILNDKRNHYYHKVVRMLMFAFSAGYSIIKGGYRQKTHQISTGYNRKPEYVTDEAGDYLADNGIPFTDPYTQRPMVEETEEPVYGLDIVEDRPTFDVYPIQNVYMSQEYSYSLNDKEYVIFETENTLDELKADEENCNYFNLNLLEADEKPEPQKRDITVSNKDENFEEVTKPVSPKFTIYERWGKFPVVVKDTGDFEVGIDEYGEFKEEAENLEAIITTVKKNKGDSFEYVIRFDISPHTKRPMVRFLCYVDPLKDAGFGDGEVVRELQTAINDNYNLMNYRTKLSITPAFKAKRFMGVDEHVKITPETAIMVENMDDLQEFAIGDNIQGGVVHQSMLTSRMDHTMATSPMTMGLEAERKETATQASIMKQRSDIRIGMKSMNFEFIGFAEFYDMLLTLCNDFMLPQTLESMIGEHAFAYNPKREDKFKPVSQALETEESKQYKLNIWEQALGRTAGLIQFNPKAPMLINFILGQMYELMGGSFKQMKQYLMEEDPRAVMQYMNAMNQQGQQPQGPQGRGGSAPKARGGGTQNQTGLPQPRQEQSVRGR